MRAEEVGGSEIRTFVRAYKMIGPFCYTNRRSSRWEGERQGHRTARLKVAGMLPPFELAKNVDNFLASQARVTH